MKHADDTYTYRIALKGVVLLWALGFGVLGFRASGSWNPQPQPASAQTVTPAASWGCKRHGGSGVKGIGPRAQLGLGI